MLTVKKVVVKILPIILSAVLTMGLIFLIYTNVMESQTENCWERLEDGATNLSVRVKRSFGDNLNLLCRVADMIAVQNNLNEIDELKTYIDSVRANTIFERIDILYPNNALLVDGNVEDGFSGQLPFSELEKRGTHISSRYTDRLTGSEVIYCTAPIVQQGETRALLIGVIECDDLKDYFSLNLYGNSSHVFLIDRTDGRFLLDNWNGYLGSLSDLATRDRLAEYQSVDVEADVKAGKDGRFAFVSQINGKVSYMEYRAVDDDKFNWTVAVMVQEDIAMENVSRLSNYMKIVAIIITVFIAVYIIWNTVIISKSVKNEERVKLAMVEKEKNKAKSVFLSSMSHDIRTPLNGIVGMLDIIDSHGDDPERVKDCLAKIRVSATYLTTLADDIIDINEMESGKLVLANQPIDINELIERINIIVTPRAEDANVFYYVTTDGVRNPYVLGSEPHIQRVLINLIGNAIKYNKENGSVWLVADEVGVGENRRYRFTVRDNGIGMSEEFQKNMFKAFEQENSGARTTYRGHGLGLTIVYRLVSEMGGEIVAESKLGEGTTFIVTIPLKEDESKHTVNIPEIKSAPKEDVPDIRGMKILVAEDNELNMEIAKVILEEAGAEIITAENGKAALAAFEKSDEWGLDLILMDIMMPEMDGMEATKKIRALSREDARHIPIVAMSAATFSDDIRLSEEAGMNEHIPKPLDSGLLIETAAKYRK